MLSETIILPKSIGGQENRFIVQLKSQLLKQIKEINKIQKGHGESQDLSNYYTKEETDDIVNTKLSELISSAPETLDTLEELANALGEDPNFATTITTQLGNKLNKTSSEYVKEISINGTTVTITKGDNSTETQTTQDTIVTVPTKTSDLTNDSGFITGVNWEDIGQKPSTFPPSTHTHQQYLTSVSWGDISDRPTIPTIPTNISAFTNDVGYITGISWDDVTNKPSFSTVSISGSYNDLVDVPNTFPPSTHTHYYAGSDTIGGSANSVARVLATSNVARHVWFSDSADGTKLVYNDNFKYNPSTNNLYVGQLQLSKNTQTININDSSVTKGTNPTSDRTMWQLRINDKNGNQMGMIFNILTQRGDNNLYLRSCRNISSNNFSQVIVSNPLSGDKYFSPNEDNTMILGNSNLRWKQLYAGTTTISTSDERKKDNISKIPDNVLDAWGDVQWYQFQFKDVLKEKGESARIHTGTIAQRIKEVFEKHGIDAFRYGLLCYDKWDVHSEIIDEDGTILQEKLPMGDCYSLRYEEALCMEAAYQRRRADLLEERIRKLEERQ